MPKPPGLAPRRGNGFRLHILSVAESEAISASEVAVTLSEPLGVVAYQFRVLHNAGLIELVGTERRRGSIQSFYRARVTGWSDLAETVEQLIGDWAGGGSLDDRRQERAVGPRHPGRAIRADSKPRADPGGT